MTMGSILQAHNPVIIYKIEKFKCRFEVPLLNTHFHENDGI
jgi:hypothetical protein